MSAEAITLQLPPSLYEYFKRQADRARRSVEAEILDVVSHAAPREDQPDLPEALAQLETLADETLWQLARSRLSPSEAAELEELHLQRQGEGLTAQENARRTFLVSQYERAMVLRAHAARVLNERGHDVSSLLQDP